METGFPPCLACTTGVLIPFSDYGERGADIYYKAWVCTNPECGATLRIDKGRLSIGRKLGEKENRGR